MPSTLRLIALAPLVMLAACASASAPPLSPGPSSAASGESAYGLFLAGQSAINSGLGGDATGYFSRAAGAANGADAHLLQSHTFTAALLAGDVKAAAAIAPTSDDDQAVRHLAGLTQAVEDMAEGHADKARTLLDTRQPGAAHSAAIRLLEPFAAAEAGDNEAAITLPDIEGDPVGAFFANLDQGKLFEHARRYDEAETAFLALIQRGDPGGIASANLGAVLERRARWTDAVPTYDQALARTSGDPTLIASRARAKAKRAAPPLPSLRASAAEALVAPASVLVIQQQEE